MDELNQYISNSASKIDDVFADVQGKAQAIYNHAQVLASVGMYTEAVDFYEQSFNILKKSIPNPVYKTLICLVGFQYASSLDYLGKYDKAGDVFALIMEVDPTGCHLGDYALFLHRRKRDFDKAQMYEFAHITYVPVKYQYNIATYLLFPP